MNAANDDPRGLLVNLTTYDTWAAAKAISFAYQKSLKNGHDTAIWLNVRTVNLAVRKCASHMHGLMADQGTSIQDMLAAFIADGGTVLMCAVCSALGCKRWDGNIRAPMKRPSIAGRRYANPFAISGTCCAVLGANCAIKVGRFRSHPRLFPNFVQYDYISGTYPVKLW